MATAATVPLENPPSTSDGRPAPRRSLQLVLFAVPLLVLGILGWWRRWMSDDGYIHLRVAQQLIAGNGLVFNAGERVEVTSSPGWVFLLASLKETALRFLSLPWIAVGTGLALTVAGLGFAQAGSVLMVRPIPRRLFIPVGALVVACLPAFWDFSTSGLETGLLFAWLGASFWLLALVARRPPGSRSSLIGLVGLGLLLGFGVLIRPDAALFTIGWLVLAVILVWRQGLARRLALLGAGVVLPAVYQVFRMGYFATLVSNTALAKNAGSSWWSQGFTYLDNFLGSYLLWLPVIALGVLVVALMAEQRRAGLSRQFLVCATTVGLALLDGVYVVRVGGDFMHARMLLPALFALAMPVAAVRLPARVDGSTSSRDRSLAVGRAAVAGLVVVWALVCAVGLRANMVSYFNKDGVHLRLYSNSNFTIDDERRTLVGETHHANPVVPADFRSYEEGLAEQVAGRVARGERFGVASSFGTTTNFPLGPGVRSRAVVTTPAIGVFSFVLPTDVYVADELSLADPIGSRTRATVFGRPGHQKPLDPAWTFARFAAPGAHAGALSPVSVAAARRAIACGRVSVLLNDITAPLSAHRFLGNIAHSFANTRLIVPPDPREAARLC